MAGGTTHRPCRILHHLNCLPPSTVTKALLVLRFTQQPNSEGGVSSGDASFACPGLLQKRDGAVCRV